MSRKCSPIVNINGVPYRQRASERGEEEKRRRGRGKLGRRAERFFSRALSQRKGRKEEGRSGRNVFGAEPGVVVVVLVVVGPRSECGCEVTHWIIQWMLGEDYFSTNPPAERALLLPTLRKPHFHLLSSFHHSIMSGEISGVSAHRATAIEPPFRARKVCRPFRSQPF